jgi:hypothetical protein
MTAPAPVDQAAPVGAASALGSYAAATGALRTRLLGFLDRLWVGLGSYRDADAERFVARAVPAVQGAQQAMASLTAAYLGRAGAELTGNPVRMPHLTPGDFVGANVRQADPEVVYLRPFVQVWTDLSHGKSLDDAVASGGARLANIAATDVQLAKTHAAQDVLLDMDEVDGYRRVLNGTKNCGLCIVAATQRYHRGDLLPIHPGCDCTVAPLKPGEALGRIVDPDMLDAVHAAIAEKFGKKAADAGARQIGNLIGPNGKPLLYRDVIISHDHGEIGPVLGVRGQKFTGPDDLTQDTAATSTAHAAPQPEPKPPKRAAVSEETQQHLAQARQGFPSAAEEWDAITHGPAQRRVDQRIAETQKEIDDLTAQLEKVKADTEAEFRAKRTPKYKRHNILSERTSSLEGQIYQRNYWLEDYQRVAAMDPVEAANSGNSVLLEVVKGDRYERDGSGRRLAPAELNQHLDTVLTTGEHLMNDYYDHLTTDPEISRLEAARDAAAEAPANVRATRVDAAVKALRARQSEVLRELLASVRPMAGHQQALGAGDAKVRADFEDLVREAEQVFPTAWLLAADKRGPISAVHSDRAYFSERPGGHDVVAFDTTTYDPRTAFTSYAAEVTAHELGHRMEVTIPGLTHLEYAMVQRRALNGKSDIPAPSALRDITGNSAFDVWEVTYEDEWPNPYTGKTYGSRDSIDPAALAWELFQVSLQDTFGRGDTVYAGTEGQRFALGVLALLGEE